MAAFRSVTEVMSAACTIQDALNYNGAIEAAEDLGKSLYAPRKTSSEALNAIAKALLAARFAVSRTLDAEALQLLDDAVAGARALTDDPDAQSPWQKLTSYFRK